MVVDGLIAPGNTRIRFSALAVSVIINVILVYNSTKLSTLLNEPVVLPGYFNATNLSEATASTAKPSTSTLRNSSKDDTSPFDMLEEVIRNFHPNEQDAQEYLSKFPLQDFRIYVYDLKRGSSWEEVFKCVEKAYKPKNMGLEEFRNTYCDWGATVCNPKQQSVDQYNARRMNRNSDGVLTKLFQDYEGPLRTTESSQATIFVAPYPTHAWYECYKPHGMRLSKKKVSREVLEKYLFPSLQYLNRSSTKHLFFQTQDVGGFHQLQDPVVASIAAPRRTKGGKTVIMPYVNTNAEYQPDRLHGANSIDWNSLFQRKNLSLAAVMSPKIAGDSRPRQQFMNRSGDLIEHGLGGMPVHITGFLNKRKLPNEQETMKLYRQSVFCPFLRGDTPQQKRLFDTIMSGCIPVVLAYKWADSASNGLNDTSYFTSGVSNSKWLPYAKGSFDGYPNMGIDYSELVVEIDGNCGIPCMKPVLESLMNSPEALKEKQQVLAKYSRLFAHGLGNNGFKFVDAVTAMLVQARHKVLTDDRTVSAS